MHWHSFWTGWIACSVFMLGLLFLTGCDIPTEYTVRSPECPWPPPMVTDSVMSLPLGCPYRLPDGTVVNPFDGLGR
jgi:hypothetical protein